MFGYLKKLEKSAKNRKKGDVLIDGYGKIITLKEYPIRLFVAQRGQSFFCQLCYLYEEDKEKSSGFFIEMVSKEILDKFEEEKWKGGDRNNSMKTYKYVMYKGDNAEQKAKNLYDRISSFVEKNNIQ